MWFDALMSSGGTKYKGKQRKRGEFKGGGGQEESNKHLPGSVLRASWSKQITLGAPTALDGTLDP